VEVHGYSVEPETPTEADRATELGRWYEERFGTIPRLTVTVPDLDAVLAELAQGGIASEPIEVDGDPDEDDVEPRGVRITGPAGATADLVQPVPPGYYDRRIGGFIDSAAGLDGPPTDELADAVLAVLADAWTRLDGLLEGVAHNKVLATMLLVSQRSREGGIDTPLHWQQSAASSLLSGFVGRGAREEP
jgi:hypothetical protein